MNNDLVNVEGEINAGYTSYGVPKQTTEDENGNMETDIWPEHIDPDELADKQRQVLKLAFTNPTLSCSDIDDEIGSTKYAYSVLKKFVPEWYENVFKSDVAKRRTSWANKDSGGQETGSEEVEIDTTVDTAVSSEGTTTDVSEVVEILKQTAVHEETEQVLAVIEGYL